MLKPPKKIVFSTIKESCMESLFQTLNLIMKKSRAA